MDAGFVGVAIAIAGVKVDLSDVAARLTRSGSLAMLAAIRRASSRTARAALIDDRCGR